MALTAKILVEDFESATTSYAKPSWIGKSTHLWMCEAFEGEIDEEDEEPKLDEDYILETFPNDQFIPDACQDVLATVDVCVNEVTPTIFVMRKVMTLFQST